MKADIDLKRISVTLLTCMMGILVMYLIFSMVKFGDNTERGQTERIVEVIRKAAVQCYALEGEYPGDIHYLSENYGIILQEDKYVYYYDVSLGSNFMPDIIVTTKY